MCTVGSQNEQVEKEDSEKTRIKPVPSQGKTERTSNLICSKVSSSYHLCVEYFSQLSFVSETYTKSGTAADFVYISETNESCEKYSTQR